MRFKINPGEIESYRTFLKIKSLPQYHFNGRIASVPDEYARLFGDANNRSPQNAYVPSPWLFDYQRDVASLAIRKQKFAVFMGCGWGKTLIMLEYARHVASVLPADRCVLIVSPLMVCQQTLSEATRFYGDSLPIEHVRAAGLNQWLRCGKGRVGITNYEAITDKIEAGRLGGLILDESSMLKSHYGKWGTRLIAMGRGLNWKLCLTGTPAPNDRIEYANHAVLLDQSPTINAFLARYFVNRGQTDNRWELKPHALRPFYRALSHWCVFIENPAVYGWKDNASSVPPIHTHIHDVPLTSAQQELVSKVGGDLFGCPGGITNRSKLGQLAKGFFNGAAVPTNKGAFIRDLVASWPDESTIVWCVYNREQKMMESVFPECASIRGNTPDTERAQLIADFQSGRRKVLVSKAKILGFGLNLQQGTRHVFSGLQDSYELFHQAVKRSNRVGSTRPLNVHIPCTSIERPMIDTVLRKASRVEEDTREQERIPGIHAQGVSVMVAVKKSSRSGASRGADPIDGKSWELRRMDCIEGMAELPPACIDFAVFSPPFPALYAYTDSESDIGNSEDLQAETKLHLSFFYRQLARVIRPGRAVIVHVAQIPRMKRSGGDGLFDFRGLNIRLAERAGLVFAYDWLVTKNPQSQAIRTKSRELQFSGLESDRARSRGCLPDYLLKFMAPGENARRVHGPGQVSRNDWIAWAEAAWTDIKETDTLNVAEGRGANDTKHICPLQLEVIRRTVLLFSDPGELVLSPFAGIGSEGYVALGGVSRVTGKRINDPRRFLGFELKEEYYQTALTNLQRAENQHKESQRTLFDSLSR